MKIIAKQNRELIMINAQNTQNENDAEKIILQVPEQYEDFNKKIVFVTPDGNVWDIITNNEYLIKKAITKYNQVDFYIWLTKDDVDFRSQTKTLKFHHNVDASDEITDEEIGRVNTVVNLLEQEITKVEDLEDEIDGKLTEIGTAIDDVNIAIQETENLNLDAQKVNKTTTVTITKKDGTEKSVNIQDGQDGQDGEDLQFTWQGTSLGIKTETQQEYTFVNLQGVQGPTGPQGEPFTIKKTYSSVAEMNADFNNMQLSDYVMIASSVEVEDNAKLYTRGANQWIFITDFSGSTGIRGETGLTPNIQIGTVTQGSSFSVTRTGTNENPILNFTLVKGDKGEQGDDYILTQQDKQDIAGLVDIPVSDVQVNGTSVVQDGVANVPVADNNTFGVLKTGANRGVRLLPSGIVASNKASDQEVKLGTHQYNVITPLIQHSAAFYGLAKAAGDTTQSQSSNAVGTYTEEAKTAICTMLGVYDAIDANITRTEFEELKQENEDLKKNQLTNTPEISTSHYLQDSADARFRKFIPIGRTTQESTTGKNLAGLIDETYSDNNVTVIVNNGKVTINGTPSSTSFFSIATNLNLISGDYVLYAFNSSTIGSSSTSEDYADIRLTDKRGGNYGNYVLLGTKNNKIGISLSNDDSTAKIVLRLGANLQFNNFVITPMLIKGTSTTEPYEPYTGGEPAPNPKYPFPIKNTGDSGSVNESVSNSDNTESQTISFPLAQGQKLYEGDYLADDGIHSLWNEDTVNGTTSTFSDAKTNGAYYCNQKVSGNLTGQTITFDTSVTNAIVQYELAQEQVIPFTQEQQQAWEQIKALRTYKNVTHISSEDETPANVEIEYVQDTKTYIDNKVTALTNAITSLGGNV